MTISSSNIREQAAGLSVAEWEALPVTLDAPTVARAIRSNTRFIQNHAEELGGIKLAGRWIFSKARIAELLGL